MKSLEEKRADRFRLLNALYETTGGDRHVTVSMWELGAQIGLTKEETSNVVSYLSGEGLAERVAMGGQIGITHRGIVEVENALSEPDQPTHYFPAAVNIMHVHTMVNSQIQQGSQGGQQHSRVAGPDLAAIKDFVEHFTTALHASQLPADAKAEAAADIATLQAQLQSPKPKFSIIGEALRSIRTMLEGAGGALLASEWLPKLLPLLASIGT